MIQCVFMTCCYAYLIKKEGQSLSKRVKQSTSYKILISACLLGERVRYDGKSNKITGDLIARWSQQGLLLPICPEVCGGLPIPRPAAEIQADGTIKTGTGIDVSQAFIRGAQKTLQLALNHNIRIAILTEKSPSCGSSQIYNGEFKRQLIAGQGVTTELLRANKIEVFNQFELEKVRDLIDGAAV